MKKSELVRWYNKSFKPAVEKAHSRGTFSAHIRDKLLAPVRKFEVNKDEEISNQISMQ